jgi:hypothetical protein
MSELQDVTFSSAPITSTGLARMLRSPATRPGVSLIHCQVELTYVPLDDSIVASQHGGR